jgi:hypothetical protein
MVDRDRVDQLFAMLTRYVRILRDLADMPLAEYQADPRNFGSGRTVSPVGVEAGHECFAGIESAAGCHAVGVDVAMDELDGVPTGRPLDARRMADVHVLAALTTQPVTQSGNNNRSRRDGRPPSS